MKRWTWLALAVLACGSKEGKPQLGSGSALAPQSDAAPARPSAPPPPTVKTGKGDCKTDHAPKPDRDPNPMCKIEGGTFDFGAAPDAIAVKLSPYFIDQFEVTNEQVAYYLEVTQVDDCARARQGKSPCFRLARNADDVRNALFVMKLPDGKYRVLPGGENRPYNAVSRQGAMDYCAWVGKTLPTEPQWEFAARHDPATNKNYQYPWGDRFEGKRARCIRDICTVAPARDPRNEPADNRPAPVGSYDGTGEYGDGRSPWGVFDMAGNVAEVVADCVASTKPCDGGVCTDPPPHPPGQTGQCEELARGGGINGEQQLLAATRGPAIMAGFRCARPVR